MIMNGRTLLGLLLLILYGSVAAAHKPSDSYLSLDLTAGTVIEGRWDIALRDLDYALGLDSDQDNAITWGELRTRHPAIAAYALARLSLTAGGGRCQIDPGPQQVEHHSDGAYTVLNFTARCATTGDTVELDYRLLFDLDPSHRGLIKISYPDTVQTAVLSPDRTTLSLSMTDVSGWQQFADYWREGVWHIWIGFDHILFLLALLLPAVVQWRNGRWQAGVSFRGALTQVAAIVTAFTVAHSITLSMAVLGWVSLPGRWVETAIAATVILAALNNLYPLVQRRQWLLAFVLGLIHGFGFASVLVDLGLPGGTLALALFGFNLGVECGQLAIVAVFLPLAFILRSSWFYRTVAVTAGSVVVALIATLWLLERGLQWQSGWL